ncbi:RnfH family protein [Oleiphilus sp. HI0071]|nr:RnfH family protein [Oleiphilus sp. HI0065]KZY81405.1 RnfH family protein [Oleiphilus sp. HI0071]KZY97329.1 RnfH family protein [Oleiphilus sp. HI0073]KZZ13063.1 RnfH family protein [Oleiphilus sp. HI0080]KZZ14040.1 RnfH family protein [Oleiphilus sp. HI0079]KZZ42730.1 RnfH family protein [Oleiphilus sp. HI0118]KZZ56603.1 RnfH family protein [Oleiphilus sp. HI0122]KZZ77711.1 RnfH family protein [Oleiphilus sp. HI0133]
MEQVLENKLRVEVAYARPDLQKIVELEVDEGTTVFDAAARSGLEKFFPEISYEEIDMGIFGKMVKKPQEERLRDGDRIELYRPLIIDPKQARLNRAKKPKA